MEQNPIYELTVNDVLYYYMYSDTELMTGFPGISDLYQCHVNYWTSTDNTATKKSLFIEVNKRDISLTQQRVEEKIIAQVKEI